MRATIIALTTMALCATAHADCGPNGSPDVVVVEDWSVEVGPDRAGMITEKVEVTLLNEAGKAIRMVDGQVIFTDALGGYISNIGIERDLSIPTDGTASWSAEYAGTGLDRIPDLLPEEVTVDACVRAVLYDDGTKETF